MKYLLLIICIAAFSCSPVKRATKHFNKGMKTSKVTMAQLTQDSFPCVVTTIDIDSSDYIRWKDSTRLNIIDSIVPFIWIDSLTCIDQVETLKGQVLSISKKYNTVVGQYNKLLKNPAPPIKSKEQIKDPRDSLLADKRIKGAEDKFNGLHKKDLSTIDKLEKKLGTKNTLFWTFFVLFLLSGLLNFILIKHR